MTPQRLHVELLFDSLKAGFQQCRNSPFRVINKRNEDIVHALWRHRELHEQGSRIGRCGWITSFLRSQICLMANLQRFYLTLYPAKSRPKAA